MTIYIGADHRGFALKEKIKAELAGEGYTIADVGAAQLIDGDDYPDYAAAVAEKIKAAAESGDKGIVICGSGFGVDIVANRFKGVRSALASSPDHIYAGRHDDDVNVLALSADFIDEVTAKKIVKTFLSTPFGKDPRYSRRIEKIDR